MIDMAGKLFGRLTVVGYHGKSVNGTRLWDCVCACGASILVNGKYLRRGDVRSCGCLQKEATSLKNTRHGHNRSNKLRTKEYTSWSNMLRRCLDRSHPKWPSYGGRGISVCKEWMDFKNFLADMGPKPSPKHTIERLDNDSGYCKENCVWATNKSQSLNRRSNVHVTHDGMTMCISDWEKHLGFTKDTLAYRIRKGWSVADAFSTPPQKQGVRPCALRP